MFYQKIVKPILFFLEPEFVHDCFIVLGEFLGRFWLTRKIVRQICFYEHPMLETEVCGLKFANPVGLAAGFDKDARLTQIIQAVGFGFMEVGAVTQFPSKGNPGRRLLRLPEDKALIVYYGLKSAGARAIYEKMEKIDIKIPTGVNIAKTNHSDIKGEKSVDDYVSTYRLLASHFSYATINISCPNVQDGCTFQDNPALLEKLVAALQGIKKGAPVFVKISNSISEAEVDRVLEIVSRYSLVDGFIITNLAKDRASLNLKSPKKILDALPQGGISGGPIRQKSNHLISYVYQKTKGKYAIIGVGGVFTAADAYEKIKAGAS
ncbi:MAG: quinone-dependent dihydroorotate dehydrogenase, partial [Patescibacteria group bacterium]